MPPAFCASATTCRANVVFPEDSGPYTSIILPFGRPPIPRAKSKLSEPVEISLQRLKFCCWPSLITEPFPKF